MGPNSQFANLPPGRSKIFCNADDAVCAGQIMLSAAHLAYAMDTGEAAQFIAQQIVTDE